MRRLLITRIIINTYLNSKNCVFLIKDYNIKVFSLSIFIKIFISRLLFNVIISLFNIKKRNRYLINNVFNVIIINIKLYSFFIKNSIAYFITYKII